ncbi:MAG: efflux RND transporter periplasmic adaptor subunit [Lysobacter sp.]
MSSSADLLKELRIDRNQPAQSSGPGRGLILGIVVLVLIVLAVAGWLVFGRNSAPAVKTASITAIGGGNSAGASVLDATGYIVARRIATVSAKITGKVREVMIEEGQRVEANEIMATLDPIDADAQRSLSAAQLAAAESDTARVQAQLKEAEANASRLGTLTKQQLVSKSQYDQAVASRDSLRAQLLTSQRNVKVSRDSLHISDLGVDNTIVRAPFAGVVTAKAAQPGEVVSPLSAGGGFTRTGIGTIVDMDSLEIEVDVGEAFIGRVQPKMPVEAILNAYPDWKIPAEVIAIIPTADRGKATVKVRIAIKSRDPRIVPEMGVRVSFLEAAKPANAVQTKPSAMAPNAALTQRDGKDVVFVVADDKVAQTAVVLGRKLGEDREVTAGLSGGETVVIDPADSLKDGSRVRVENADADSSGKSD